MTDTPQLSGRDLARQALAAYKATARTAPAAGPAKPRRKRALRPGDGRDPVTLAAAIAGLGADVPLEAGLAGGSVINQWPNLCPQYDGLIQPVHYDEKTGRLDLRPGSHSYAAQLRLLGGQLARQINDKLGKPVVRTIRVLPVGAITTTPSSTVTDRATDAEAPVKTRADASPGYLHTLALALQNKPEHTPTAPYVIEALERQEQALRANRQPESEHREATWAQLDAEEKAGPPPGSVEDSLARARAYARQQRTGRAPRRAFDPA
ncbi:DciA family protein [Streptomyces sp. NPDC001658]